MNCIDLDKIYNLLPNHESFNATAISKIIDSPLDESTGNDILMNMQSQQMILGGYPFLQREHGYTYLRCYKNLNYKTIN